jgi:hypothetical protein
VKKYAGLPDKDGLVGHVVCCGLKVGEITELTMTALPDYERSYIYMGKFVVREMLPVKHSTHYADKKAGLRFKAEEVKTGVEPGRGPRLDVEMDCVEMPDLPRGHKERIGEKVYDLACPDANTKFKPEVTGADFLAKLKAAK